MKKKQIFIIDGHALVYRAYYAFIKNPLINSKGQPTSAVFGFANYILRLIENWSCHILLLPSTAANQPSGMSSIANIKPTVRRCLMI